MPIKYANSLGEIIDEGEPKPFNYLGQPGTPDTWKDDFNQPKFPVPVPVRVVDALGRVDGKTYPELDDNIPDFLRSSAVAAKTTKTDTDTDDDKTLTRKVTILRDTSLVFPYLCLKVFVQPDPSVSDDEARYARMFARSQCRRAPSILEADLVVFSGGSDVDPTLYGEDKHETTFFSPSRDTKDMDLYLLCLEQGIPMFGVCRGAQFLHVMQGGKLFQHVDNHNSSHPIIDLRDNKRIEKISSVHHQMCRENIKGGMQVIATAAKSTERWITKTHCFVGDNADIEAFFYPDALCLGVQGHPEYDGYHYYTTWCLKLIENYVFENPDLTWQDGVLRMRPELLEERRALLPLPDQIKLSLETKGL